MATRYDLRLQQPTPHARCFGSEESGWGLQRILNSDQGAKFQIIVRSIAELGYPNELTLQLMQAVTNVAMALWPLSGTTNIRIPPNLFVHAVDTYLDSSMSKSVHQDSTCTVFKGTHKNHVAHFKEYRFPSTGHSETDIKALTMCQASLCLHFEGPGLLPIAGLCQQVSDSRTFIVELRPRGWTDLSSYLIQTPDANRMLLVKDIVEPLARFHAGGVVLGPVTKQGVGVTPNGRAYLSSFDYLRLEGPTTNFALSVGCFDTVRRLPPEVIRPLTQEGDGHFAPLTKASDIYSLGCFIFELFTGQPPFAEHTKFARGFSTVLNMIASSQRLHRPAQTHGRQSDLTDDVWALIEKCCAPNPAGRPSAQDLLQFPLLKNLRR